MSRSDLLALTPEAVATLANLGLVKRAQREIAAGGGPTLEEDAGGVVTGRFADGVVASLPPGVALRDASCSCGASGVCRHRVAVALAYPAWAAASTAAAATTAWSPGAIDDEALARFLGKRTMEKAQALRRLGADVEVRRVLAGAAEREEPAARLPTCTVRFLVPADLAYAHCDCAEGEGCEHVALAVWAFREADEGDRDAAVLTVHVGVPEGAEAGGDPLAEAVRLGREVLLEGVAGLGPSFAQRIARARATLDAAGFTWPGTLVDDLEECLEAYRARSARYSPAQAAALLGELAARVRAARGTGELPARYVLGKGESRETPLGHLRLLSLGACLEAEGRERAVEVFLADPEAGLVLVLRKRWTYGEEEEPEDGPRLAGRTVVTGVRLRDLARGQLVTRVARRQANRLLRLGSGRQGGLTVTPQTASWGDLPEGLLVRDLERHAAELRARPPRWLRPRVLAEAVHVVPLDAVEGVVYDPGRQTLQAVARDARGTELLLTRRHRGVAPGALDALAAALGDGASPPAFASGFLRLGAHGLELEPIAVASGGRLVVPDIEPAEPRAGVPLGKAELDGSPLHDAIARAASCLEEASHAGILRLPPGWSERVDAASRGLEEVGLAEAARRLDALRHGAARARQARDASAPEAQRAAAAWEGAAVVLALARESL